MGLLDTQSVTIPVKQASQNKEAVKGKLYGSGDIVIIFSNMDTNDQNE